jgi:hypothetical protein
MHHETNHTQTAVAAAVQPDNAAVSEAPKLPQQEAVSASQQGVVARMVAFLLLTMALGFHILGRRGADLKRR